MAGMHLLIFIAFGLCVLSSGKYTYLPACTYMRVKKELASDQWSSLSHARLGLSGFRAIG